MSRVQEGRKNEGMKEWREIEMGNEVEDDGPTVALLAARRTFGTQLRRWRR